MPAHEPAAAARQPTTSEAEERRADIATWEMKKQLSLFAAAAAAKNQPEDLSRVFL